MPILLTDCSNSSDSNLTYSDKTSDSNDESCSTVTNLEILKLRNRYHSDKSVGSSNHKNSKNKARQAKESDNKYLAFLKVIEVPSAIKLNH